MVTFDNNFDSFEDDFPQAGRFLEKLRRQLKRVNVKLDEAVTLHTNSKKGVMYIRGTTMTEAYMWALYDYLQEIKDVFRVEFKLPMFGLECIQFQFVSPDNEVQILGDDKLRECVQNRIQDSLFNLGDDKLRECVQNRIQHSLFQEDS